jgi:hypothetical protein
MPEPTFTEATERLYAALPGVYRFEDGNHDWQMKKWLAGILDVENDIEVLLDRIKYVPPEDGPELEDLHSDLVDPDQADEEWLPWLAQLVGVHFNYLITTAQKRERIKSAIGGVRAGTKAHMIEAAKAVLTGTQTVFVYPFSNSGGGINAGTQWEVLVITKPDETAGDVVAAITNAGAKPAGVKIYHVTDSNTWAEIAVASPTWADWNAKTWQQLEQG